MELRPQGAIYHYLSELTSELLAALSSVPLAFFFFFLLLALLRSEDIDVICAETSPSSWNCCARAGNISDLSICRRSKSFFVCFQKVLERSGVSELLAATSSAARAACATRPRSPRRRPGQHRRAARAPREPRRRRRCPWPSSFSFSSSFLEAKTSVRGLQEWHAHHMTPSSFLFSNANTS